MDAIVIVIMYGSITVCTDDSLSVINIQLYLYALVLLRIMCLGSTFCILYLYVLRLDNVYFYCVL